MKDLLQREEEFKKQVDSHAEFDQELRDRFFNYWSEPNRSKTKMRCELEKTWCVKRRLKTFFDNQNNRNGQNNTAIGPTGKQGTSAARVEAARNF